MKKFTTQKINQPNSYILGCAKFMFCVAFLFIFSFSTQAAVNVNKHLDEIKIIENYLNNIKNLSAKFIQESHNKNIVEGKFLLSRPGKMRIEYLAKPKIVIIVNGSVLSYYDTELDEISFIRTNTTPASFLTRKNISFLAKDVEIKSFYNSKNYLKISVEKKNHKESGEFSLIFSKNPIRFEKMEVKNDLDQVTTITLYDIDLKSNIKDSNFITKKRNEEEF